MISLTVREMYWEHYTKIFDFGFSKEELEVIKKRAISNDPLWEKVVRFCGNYSDPEDLRDSKPKLYNKSVEEFFTQLGEIR